VVVRDIIDDEVYDIMNKYNTDETEIIVCGDFNGTINPSIDKSSKHNRHTSVMPEHRTLKFLTEQYNLIDSYTRQENINVISG
jgi:exonuclease III